MEFAAGLAQQVETGLDGGGFGAGGIETAEGHIVGPFGLGGVGQVEAVVTGNADDGLGTQQGTGLGRVRVVTTEVDAISPTGRGQGGIVVDNEQGACRLAKRTQGLSLREASGLILALVAVLDESSAPY